MSQVPSGLHGKLEELGLDEILQIIGISRRTGILTLTSQGREAVLYIRDGLLVRISSTGIQQKLGELLIRSEAVSHTLIQQALQVQQQECFKERIGTILNHRFQVDLQLIENTVRAQMSAVLVTLFAWIDGDFAFDAREVETVDAAFLDPVQFLLEMDETDSVQLTENGFGCYEEPATAAVAAASPVVPQPLPVLIVVDDDATLAKAIVESVVNRFQGDVFIKSEEALQKIDSLYKSGKRPLVLVDLIMPRMDGTGVLGGLELLQLLRQNFPDIAVTVMSDFKHDEAYQQMQELGVVCLDKPRRGDIGGTSFSQFRSSLEAHLGQLL